MAGISDRLVRIVVWLAKSMVWLFPGPPGVIPEPGRLLTFVLRLLLGGDQRLKVLESLSDIYFPLGLFRYGRYVYLLDPRLAKTAIARLDKGADSYLQNSPLADSFLGSADRSPDTRRAIAAIFRKSSIEDKASLMIPVIEKTVEKVAREATVNVNQVSLQMALDVVGHVLLGLDLGALDGRQDSLLTAMMTILHRAYSLGEISVDSPEFKQAGKDLDSLTSQILMSALDANDNKEKSLAKTLYDITGFKECKSNMELFLMAGSETTASSLPVFLHLLVSTPGLQAELQAEADEYIGRLRQDAGAVPPRLDGAIREVLRTYAIAPYISRQTRQQLTLGHYSIPPDTSLRVFTWGIHRSPELWPQPKSFQPERFCPGFKSGDTASERGQYWIPFGAGARVCIGQHLAWLELKLALTFLLHHFTFTKVKATEELEFCVDWEHAVVHPVKDVVLGVARRH